MLAYVNQSTYLWPIEPIVRSYQKSWLTKYATFSSEWADQGIPSPDMTDPSNSYLMPEGQAAEYFAYCDDEAAKAGFELEKGYCPLLVAEDNKRKAEKLLLQELKNATGLEVFNPFISIENRKKIISYAMQYVIKHPYFNKL